MQIDCFVCRERVHAEESERESDSDRKRSRSVDPYLNLLTVD